MSTETTPQERLEEMARGREFAIALLDAGYVRDKLLADAQILRSAANFREKVEELLAAYYNAAAIKDGNQPLATVIRRIQEDVRAL